MLFLIEVSIKMNKPRQRDLKMTLWVACPYCYWCAKLLHFFESTIDHVIPTSKGGENNDKNMVLSCIDCNGRKGDRIIKKGDADFEPSSVYVKLSEIY